MASKAISVSDDMTRHARRHIRSGRYDTVADVLKAGLEALDREEAALDAMLREKIQEALDDPRPSIPAEEAFDRFWKRIEASRAAEQSRNV